MPARRQDRRTFLRHTVEFAGVSVVGGLAGCVDGGPGLDLSDGDEGSGPDEDALTLRPGMELGTLFTGPGGLPARSEVDPDEPGGGRLIAVDDVDPGRRATISWRETTEREITPTETTNVGVGTTTPTPRVEVVERTGSIAAGGLATAHEPLLPMHWTPGETTTDTSAMWLSREAFRELRDDRRTSWSADPLTRISWVGEDVRERIHSGVNEVDDVLLEAEADFVDFDLDVADQRTTVAAIAAHDSFGNEYVVLANEANPLVVKFTYDAVSVGFTGFDTAVWTLIKAVFSGFQVVTLDPP